MQAAPLFTCCYLPEIESIGVCAESPVMPIPHLLNLLTVRLRSNLSLRFIRFADKCTQLGHMRGGVEDFSFIVCNFDFDYVIISMPLLYGFGTNFISANFFGSIPYILDGLPPRGSYTYG
jgi:hypothetical protein